MKLKENQKLSSLKCEIRNSIEDVELAVGIYFFGVLGRNWDWRFNFKIIRYR